MKFTTLFQAVDDYLDYRSKLGFAIKSDKGVLYNFARFADVIGHRGHITIELVIRWATLSKNPGYLRDRYNTARRFTKYIQSLVPETEIPPEGMVGGPFRQLTPYIYSNAEIANIMKAAMDLNPMTALHPYTYMTLFGLLACTGMRISEALGLSIKDVDFKSKTITVVDGKFHKSRILPIHHTVVEALKHYTDKRDKIFPATQTKAFFINVFGSPLAYQAVIRTFHQIRLTLGLKDRAGKQNPRIHDFRHTFVVHKLLEWHRNGDDVEQKIAQLSTYLGHTAVTSTYWYLTAAPELMAIVAARFEKFISKGEKQHD